MKEGPVCTALTSLLWDNQKNPVFLVTNVGQDVTVRMWHPPFVLLHTWFTSQVWEILRSSLNKKKKKNWPLAHGQATPTQIFLKRDKIVLSMSRKVQLLCAAGGWHQVSPASLCGTVWRHKDRQRWWGDPFTPHFGDPLHTVDVWAPSLTVVSKVFISLSKEDVKYTGK